MPGMLAYGDAASNALNALQTGLNIGDEIKNGPADRQYVLQQRQLDLANREKSGKLADYELQDRARTAHIQAATDNLAKLYNDPKVAEYTPEQFAELTNHAGVPDNIGSPDFGQHLSTVMGSMTGSVDKNSPQALNAYNQVFSPQVNAAIGAVGDKGPIVGQKAAQIVPSATGGIHVDLQNTTANGSTYNAPATVGRGAHDDAPVKDVNPEEAIQHTMGLAQIHDDIQQNPNSPFAQAAAKWQQLPEDQRTQLRQQAIRKQYLAVTGQIPPNQTLVKSEPGYFITQDADGAMKVTPVEGNTGGEGFLKAAEDGVRKHYWGSVKEGLANLKGEQNLKVQVAPGSGKTDKLTDDSGALIYRSADGSMTDASGNEYAPKGTVRPYQTGTPRSGQAIAVQKYLQENPHATSADVQRFMAKGGATTQAYKSFSTGKDGQAVNSLNVATEHLNLLRDLGHALKNGDEATVNRISNAIGSEFGKPAPSNFDEAKQIVADEIIKAVIGAGGGSGDRDTLQNSFNKNGSPDKIDGAIDTAFKLMGGQLRGKKKLYDRTVNDGNFNDLLTSDAQAAMGKHLSEEDSSGAAVPDDISAILAKHGGSNANP